MGRRIAFGVPERQIAGDDRRQACNDVESDVGICPFVDGKPGSRVRIEEVEDAAAG